MMTPTGVNLHQLRIELSAAIYKTEGNICSEVARMNVVTIHNEKVTRCVHIPGAIFISSAESLNLQCDKREAVQQKKTFTTARFMEPCVSSAYRKDLCDPSNQCPKLRKIICEYADKCECYSALLIPKFVSWNARIVHCSQQPPLLADTNGLSFLPPARKSLPWRQKLLRGPSSVHRFGTSTLS